jgi:putative ABC transport system permease protein
MKYATLVWTNLMRNKIRTGLTDGAIALAIALVCLLLSMPAGIDRMMDSMSENTRIGIHAKAGLVYAMPASYLQKVRGLPGVVDATTYNWFGGAVDPDKGVEFPNFSVDPEHIGTVFADWDIDPAQLEEFKKNRDAALVGRSTLERQGWKVGDRVSLTSTIYGFALEFRVVGVLDHGQNPSLWFQREYLEQTLEAQGMGTDEIGMIWIRVDDEARVAPLMREVDEMFRNSEVQTSSETEKSFYQNFIGSLQGVLTILLIVTGLIALCIVFIAANTASMAVRERLRELAILKAIGFSWRAIFGTLLAEAVLLSTVAGLIGAFASFSLASAMQTLASARPMLGPLSNFVIGPTIAVQGLFLALFIGMISGVVPSFGAARKSVVASLREVF